MVLNSMVRCGGRDGCVTYSTAGGTYGAEFHGEGWGEGGMGV